MSDSRSFMRKFRKEIESDINAFVSELNTQLKVGTPVKSGRARSGWEQQSRVSLTGQSQTVITNNTPYIGVLDTGTSRQAPQGIFDPAVRRANRRRR